VLRTRCAPALAIAAVLALALGGCTARDVPTIDATAAAPSATATATRTAGPDRPATTTAAARELTRFDAVNRATVAATREPGGRAFIDALVAAGYRRADMQVTEDRTSVGRAVPSVQFSVLWRGRCLVGQHGDGAGRYRGVLADPVDGRCLIGTTRSIDW